MVRDKIEKTTNNRTSRIPTASRPKKKRRGREEGKEKTSSKTSRVAMRSTAYQ